MQPESGSVPVDAEKLKSYGIACCFTPTEEEEPECGTMRDLSFHAKGEFCVTSRSDGVISLLDCVNGKTSKVIYSKRYGVDLVQYTHHPDCILMTSSSVEGSTVSQNQDHRIRYHSMYDNQYLRYFSGHSAIVVSLMMHPTTDEFLSASMDGTIRLWDLRAPDAASLLQADHGPVMHICAAYDHEGVVFGVYTDDYVVRMYDARNYQEGPFAKFSLYDASILSRIEPYLAHIQSPSVNVKKLHATSIQFSPDGNNLLLGTNRGVFLQLDAFEGTCRHMYPAVHHIARPGRTESGAMQIGATFSADGSFVTIGGEDGRVWNYSASTGEHVATFQTAHHGPVVGVAWNPQRHLLASIGGKSTVFWSPKPRHASTSGN